MKRRGTYEPAEPSIDVQAQVVLALCILGVVIAGGIWAAVSAFASHLLRSLS